MCRRVTCSECGLPSYAGCGQHVEQVLASTAPAQRCRCPRGVVRAAERPTPARPARR